MKKWLNPPHTPRNSFPSCCGLPQDALLQSLGADREKVTALLNDKAGLSQLLQSEQVRTLLQQLLAGQAPPAP